MRISAIIMILLPLVSWGQTSSKDSITDNFPFRTLEQVLQDSEKISSKTFELKFLLRSLPDNGWFLKLHKDSTFEYIHWNGWSESEGIILEKGVYSIQDNLLTLVPEYENSDLKKIEFYLVTSQTDAIDNNITIDCVQDIGLMYCLYHR